MRRWVLGLMVVLGVAVLAILLKKRGDEVQPPVAVEEESATATPDEDGALVSPPANAPEFPEAIPAETTARQPLLESQDASAEEPASPRATLVVRTIAETTGEPLEGVTVDVVKVLPPVELLSVLGGGDGESTLGAFFEDLDKRYLGLHRTTDAGGSVEYPVPPGQAIALTAEGQDLLVGKAEQTITPLLPGERREIVVKLSVGGRRFHGRVLDREKRIPVVGARVSVTEEEDEETLSSVPTDSTGAFEVVVSQREDFNVRIEAEGFGPAYGKIRSGHESPATAQVFRLARSASLVGRVLDARREPIEWATVWVRTNREDLFQPVPGGFLLGSPDDEDPVWSAEADEDGRFRLVALPPRVSLELGLGDEEHPRMLHLTLAPGEERTMDIVREQEVVLAGQVLDQDGRAVPELELWMNRSDPSEPSAFFSKDWLSANPLHTLQTGPDGRFRQLLLPGTWRVGPAPEEEGNSLFALLGKSAQKRARVDSERFAPFGTLIEVQPEPGEQESILRVERGLFIRGRVVDPDGHPVGDSWVSSRTSSFYGRSARCAADGSFALGPLVDGQYFLSASAQAGFRASEEVSARPGGEDLVLHLQRSAGSLRVRVVEAGRGVGAELWGEKRGDPRSDFGWSADENGEAEWKALAAGIYDLIATSQAGGIGFASGLSPSGQEEPVVTIELQQSTTVRVTYLGDEPWVLLRGVRDETPVSFGLVRSGTSGVLLVPPGPLTIEATPMSTLSTLEAEPGAVRWSRDVEAVLGEEPEVVFP